MKNFIVYCIYLWLLIPALLRYYVILLCSFDICDQKEKRFYCKREIDHTHLLFEQLQLSFSCLEGSLGRDINTFAYCIKNWEFAVRGSMCIAYLMHSCLSFDVSVGILIEINVTSQTSILICVDEFLISCITCFYTWYLSCWFQETGTTWIARHRRLLID